MKFVSFFLGLCLTIVLLPEVHSQKLRDVGLKLLTETLPCVIPCVLNQFDKVAKRFEEKCSPNFEAIKSGRYFNDDSGEKFVLLTDSRCDLIRETFGCIMDVIHDTCGTSLSRDLRNQYNTLLNFAMDCPPNRGHGEILACLIDDDAIPVFGTCVQRIYDDYEDTSALFGNGQDYATLYSQFFTTNDPDNLPLPTFCQIAKSYMECLDDELDGICSISARKTIKDEAESLYELINCVDPRKPFYDTLLCPTHPDVTAEDGKPAQCARNKSSQLNMIHQDFDTSRVVSRAIIGRLYEFNKICVLVDFFDDCIEDALLDVDACRSQRFILTTYRQMAYPLRNFLVDQCNNGVNMDENRCQDLFTGYNINGASESAVVRVGPLSYVLAAVMALMHIMTRTVTP